MAATVDSVRAWENLIVRLAAAHSCLGESVTHLDALDGLNAHQCTRQPGVQTTVPLGVGAQAWRATPRHHLDDPTEGVTVAPGASHVGIAVDDDEFVHAPSSRGVVRVERLTLPYWQKRFVGARRVR